MKKNIIIITGGAGFVGSNLIKCLLDKTKYDMEFKLFIYQVQSRRTY